MKVRIECVPIKPLSDWHLLNEFNSIKWINGEFSRIINDEKIYNFFVKKPPPWGYEVRADNTEFFIKRGDYMYKRL